MSKQSREMFRITDLLTLHAVSSDPAIRIRVTWKNSHRQSYYHGPCAAEMGTAKLEAWVSDPGMKVHFVKRREERWAHWRAICPHCRSAINEPRRQEQLDLIMELP